jgi:hypothetical protein
VRKAGLPHSAESGNRYAGFRYLDQKAMCTTLMVRKAAIEGREEVRIRYDAVFIDVDGTLLWVDLGLEGCTKSET